MKKNRFQCICTDVERRQSCLIVPYTPEGIIICENNGKSIQNGVANPLFLYFFYIVMKQAIKLKKFPRRKSLYFCVVYNLCRFHYQTITSTVGAGDLDMGGDFDTVREAPNISKSTFHAETA